MQATQSARSSRSEHELTPLPSIRGRHGLQIAGLLLALAGIIFLMGVITAETQYPGAYTTHDNEISDLGATRPPNSVSHQPSAAIFNATCLTTGSLILGSAWLLRREKRPAKSWVTVGLLGAGVFGVGVVPGNIAPFHGLFAMLAFVAGGLAGILVAPSLPTPARELSYALGVVALGSLVVAFLADLTPLWDELGDGGVERWVAYPVVLWLVVFGGFLLGTAQPQPGD